MSGKQKLPFHITFDCVCFVFNWCVPERLKSFSRALSKLQYLQSHQDQIAKRFSVSMLRCFLDIKASCGWCALDGRGSFVYKKFNTILISPFQKVLLRRSRVQKWCPYLIILLMLYILLTLVLLVHHLLTMTLEGRRGVFSLLSTESDTRGWSRVPRVQAQGQNIWYLYTLCTFTFYLCKKLRWSGPRIDAEVANCSQAGRIRIIYYISAIFHRWLRRERF